MITLVLGIMVWLHNSTIPPDPPDVEYPAFERDFVTRDAYLRYLEQ